MVKLSNEDFSMEKIGRGKWDDWHSVGFAIEEREQAIHEYEHVMIACNQIRCKECHDHALKYITKTAEYVWSFLTNNNITNSEVIDLYNRWLYDFHYQANLNSGKDQSKIPTYDDVAEYYLSFEICTSGCSGKSS